MKRSQIPQLELQFETPDQLAEKRRRIELDRITKQRESWELCWGWNPVVEGYAEFSTICATSIDGHQHYVYGAECRILELSETDCVAICMCEASPANGLTFRISLADIWPPVRRLSAEHEARRLDSDPQ